MANVADALKAARHLLNDDMGLTHSDALLMPGIVQAHNELVAKLALNGIQVTLEQSDIIEVDAGDTELTMPTDVIAPISVWEIDRGGDPETAIEVMKSDFIPFRAQDTVLGVWAWLGQIVKFVGATTDRDVIFRYSKSMSAPTKVTEELFFKQSEIYLGPRAAALRILSGKDRNQYDSLNSIAEANLSTVVRAQVKKMLPVRRRPFSAQYRQNRRW